MARVRVRKGQSEKENADSFVCKYVCLCVHSEYDEHSIECEDFRCGFSLYMYIFVFFPVIYEEHSTNEDDKPLILSAARTITLSFFYLFVRARSQAGLCACFCCFTTECRSYYASNNEMHRHLAAPKIVPDQH